jgi:hypothetical protein
MHVVKRARLRRERNARIVQEVARVQAQLRSGELGPPRPMTMDEMHQVESAARRLEVIRARLLGEEL